MKTRAQMKVILFTKSLLGLGVSETRARAKELGYDGVDFAVRPGHRVNPDNARLELPDAVRLWRDMGLET